MLRISAAALTVPLVLLAAGCGESSSGDPFKPAAAGGDALDPKGPSNEALTVEALSKQAETGFKELTNLHIEGTGKVYDLPLGVDIKVGTAEQAEGRITLQDKALDLIAVDKTTYVKIAPGTVQTVLDLSKRAEAASSAGTPESAEDKELGEQFTKMFAEGAKLVEGKYIKFGGAETGKLGQDLLKGGKPSLDGLFGSDSGDSEDPANDRPMTKGPTTEINGTKVIPLISKDEDGTTVTMYVAANGKPFPIRLTADDKSDGTNEVTLDLKYSKLTGGISPKAPAPGDTVDLNGLLKSFGGGLFGEDKTA
ncbi:hypothetical protein [Embleya scabrispora]|uniref:hypothetical protein n=1 Tax=Embleya scabrispora TaxID=159449 RepID=UPI00131A13B2|nr:hypothetical protein [Embleya scabrispora]MYS83275.1 hypothetical protein [Streptomyces sp. SID5474]